jgi:hypothetical protein
MYCPRCGHQSNADALRFCSNCGFKLGVVKASLADDDESSLTTFTIQEIKKELRQRDINIGVILMFAGSMLATLLAGSGGLGVGREGGALILAISFASILLLSRPIMKTIYKLLSWEEPAQSSLNQRGILFGSIVMFTSTIVLAVSSLLLFGRMRTPQLLLALAGAFVVLLLLSKELMRAVRYLVAGEVTHDPTLSAAGPVLTAGQNVPASLFTAHRVTTAEILSPASVTEQTTNLLENK